MSKHEKERSALKMSPSAEDHLKETFVLLDNSSGRGPPSYLFSHPKEIISVHNAQEVGGAFSRLQECLDAGLYAAGFFSYELGYILEPCLQKLLPEKRRVPLLWFGLYSEAIPLTELEVDRWLSTHSKSGSYQFSSVSQAWTKKEYIQRFEEVQEKIRSGDIYQLNLTFKAQFKLSGSPLTFYRDLRQRQRVAYGGIVDTGEVTVLSASPELFIEKNDRALETRPMKGTSPRGGTAEADNEARRMLASDIKQRAENLMIVDLMRNDIGRISEIGSVHVSDLFTVETYRTLHQMTSGVRATLKKNVSIIDLIRAIFPPGSVIGAPKIRAQELIAQYETEPRGVYCGAIGMISPTNNALFNVAIRTPIIFRDGSGEMGIGSGIVYDSVGPKEYEECLLKMKFLTDPPKTFELIETILWEKEKGFWLLDRHFARLKASVQYFSFKFDEAAAKTALEKEAASAQKMSDRLRIRLLLAEDGRLTVTSSALPPSNNQAMMRFVISPTRLNSKDTFLFHKTTRRELYDQEWKYYSETFGADEVLYLNEKGEIAEGSRTNIFIESNSVLRTPFLDAGLLPGVLRTELLETGRAVEEKLSLEDLEKAQAIFLGNSVRGLVKACFLDTTQSV
ncbi:MAG: aminodeoxychorismate synthase component I [Hyphomicrobium sp.]